MNFKIADSKFKELLLPTLLIVMALNISSVVDSFFVGAFIGELAVSAIEVLEPLILLVTVFEWLFGLGGQILALNKKQNLIQTEVIDTLQYPWYYHSLHL